MSEIEFIKYKTRGAYHWDQISLNPLKRNAFVLGRYRNVIKLVKSCYSEGLRNKNILDVGCGDGVLAHMLRKLGARVHGVDNSEIAIEHAKMKNKSKAICFEIGDAYKLPWEDKYFDVVVSSDVIEHITDVDRAISEMKRVTKVNGFVIMTTPIRLTKEPLDKNHVIEWFPEEYRQIIRGYFPETNFYETHPLFWMELLLRSRLLRYAVNTISLIINPFDKLKSSFRYNALQASVSHRGDK